MMDFASAIAKKTTPVSHSRLGLEVVLALEGLEASLRAHGEPTPVRSAKDVLAGGRDRAAVAPGSNGNGAAAASPPQGSGLNGHGRNGGNGRRRGA